MSGSGHGAPSQRHDANSGGHGHHGFSVHDYREKRKAAKRLADTIELHHADAYNSAALEFLKNDEGEIDYDKLKDEGLGEKMADKMADFYLAKGKEYLGVGDIKLSDTKKNMIMRAYAGVTRDELRSTAADLGEDFTLERYKNLAKGIRDNVEKELTKSAAAGLKRHDLEAIVDEMGLKGKLDHSKMDVPEATALLDLYHGNDGHVPDKAIRKMLAYTGGHDAHAPAAAGHH